MTATAPEAQGTTAETDVTDPAVKEAAPNTNSAGRTPEEELEHWKSMARKNEANAKANKKAAEELEEIRKAQMTAEEKAAAAAKERETEFERIKAENIRFKAAAVHGISEENFDLLGTGSEDEILIRAQRVGEFEDAVNEVASLREQLAAAQQQIAVLTGGATPPPPQSVSSLKPGSPALKDDSYPASWFPQTAVSNTNQ